jgi:hypothetical protein
LVVAGISVVAVVTLEGVEEEEETHTVEGVTEVVVAVGAAATHTLIKEGIRINSRTNSRANSRTAVR